ncbi:MAG: hypothetical protein B7Z39_00995 [Novosphingobium sp. 12-64-8]|nr:MAG: hypothetical protein B7Z39_00995 [Novosphingobium sp. 12-64-8]
MTNHLKSSLLAATAMLAAGSAQAQVVFPASDLHGTGASSVQDIFPREANCVGPTQFAANATTGAITASNSFTQNADGTVSARRLPDGTFNGAIPFDCGADNIQPSLTVRYLGVGSGSGRAQFIAENFQTVYTAAAPSPTIFGSTVKDITDASGNVTTPGWAHTHFALSDSPLKSTERDAFNARAGVGKIIQFPLYVLPVSVAYSPIYASNTATGFTYQFNIAVPATDSGVATGGLRLSKVAYCGIFNGTIVNWNDNKIAATNYAVIDKKTKKPVIVPLYDPNRDSASRWATEGAPIRLVGRLDKSGTTDIFTRHLAAACGTVGNKFVQAAESLPFDSTSAIDLTAFRPDTNYKPAVAASNFAGTTQSLNGVVYQNTTNGFVVGTGGAADAISTTPGTAINGTGLFTVAAGSGNVRDAIATISVPNATVNVGALKFNGKIGYISADNVLPAATTGGLHSAALETGASVNLTADATFPTGFKVAGKKPVFSMPTALNATAAFGKTILAPEADAKGNYKADKTLTVSRGNALDWYNVLYAGGIKDHLNNPTLGYPMTGTTQLITGTCFASAADRNALTTLVLSILGKNTKTKTGSDVSANLFTGLASPEAGIRAQAGIAPLPLGWRTAIANTFFGFDKKTLPLQLFIQNGMATSADLPTAGVAIHKAGSEKKQSVKTIIGYTAGGPNPTVTYSTIAGKPPVTTITTARTGCVNGQGL